MSQYGKKLCALLLAACLLLGALPVSTLAAEESLPAQFVGQQLNLGDDLTMHFYVSVDAAYTDSAVMTALVGGSAVGTYPVAEMTPEEDGTYKFSVDLAAAQMTEEISMILTSGEETLAQKTYTVRDYAEVLLEGSYSDETKALVRQMLDYGGKAQLYFEHNTDDLANAGFELETAAAIPAEETALSVSGSVSGVEYYAASLVFVTKLAVRYYFRAPDGLGETVFLADGVPYTPVSKDGLYYIEVPGVEPQNLDKTMEIIVSDGESDLNVNYSPMCYITRMYNKETTGTALKALLQAAYGYHLAAAEFTGVVEYCTVSFSDGVESQQVVKGTAAAEPEEPVKDGYTFLGWYDGETAYDFTQPVTADVSLTAKWELDTADLWNDFTDASCADVWVSSDSVVLTHLDSYAGAEGVLKIENTGADCYIGATDGVNWPALYSKYSYTDVTALSFRVRLEGDALNTVTVYGMNSGWSRTLFQDVSATDGWVEYTVSVDAAEEFESMNGLYLTFWSNGASKLYIDQITVERIPLEMWNDFSDPAAAEVWTNGAGLSWLESYAGAKGVLKIENTANEKFIGNTNGINWPAVREEAHYASAAAIKFRVKIEGSALNTLTIWGRNYTWSKKLFQVVTATDGWVEYATTFDGAAEFDAMNGMFLTFWSNGASAIYIDEITVDLRYTVSFSDGVASQTVDCGETISEPEAPVKENSVFLGWYDGDTLFDFAQPVTADISLTAKWKEIPADLWNDFGEFSAPPTLTGSAASWLDSYDGANGVLKLESSAAQNQTEPISTIYADIWCAPASVQVLADQPAEGYADIRTDTVYLDAVRNEYETGQIIVTAKGNISFTVSMSDLVHTEDATAVISSDNCEVYTQKYITISNVQHGNGAPAGEYPDALLPQENAIAYEQNKVSSGENGGAWLSFYIPKDAKPGTYTGTVLVTVKGLTQQQVGVPVSLRVYDVELSDETTSKSLFTIVSSALSDYEQDSSTEMYNKYIQFLVDHRLAPSSIPAMSTLAEEGDSDMRVWAKTVWYWYEKGLRTIPLNTASETVNGYGFFNMDGMRQCLLELAKLSLEKGVDLVALTAVYDWAIDEPFYVSYTAAHIQNNIDCFNEIVETAAQELEVMDGFDSELGETIIASVLATPHVITDFYGNEFRIRAPMVFTDGTAFSYEGQNVALCPKFNDYNTLLQRSQYDLLANDEKWWYGCNEPRYPYPSYHIEDTPVSAAVIGWMMADYGVTGNLYWAINSSYYNGGTVSDPYSLADTGTGANGEGIIVYPGRYYGVDGPVGTVRTSSILDGNEDHELIKMVMAGYEAQGLSADKLLETITACVYDGTKVLGSSQEFEEARKALLTAAEAMSAGVCYSNAELRLDGSEKQFVFTQSDGTADTLSFVSPEAVAGSADASVSWGPIFSQGSYEDAIALSFKMKVEGSGTADLVVYGYDGAWKLYGDILKGQASTDDWQSFTLSVDVAEEYESLEKLFFVLRADMDTVVYLDEITVVRSHTVSFSDGIAAQRVKIGGKAKQPSDPIKPGYRFLGWYDGDTAFDFTQVVSGDTHLTAKWEAIDREVWYDFGDSASANVWTSGATLTWLESYEGAAGVLKIEKSGSGSNYIGSDTSVNWPAEYTREDYTNVTALKFRVLLEGDGYHSITVWGLNGAWSKILLQDQLATEDWVEFTVSVDIAEQFESLNGMHLTVWSSGAATMYLDSITVVRSYTVSFSDGVEAQTVEAGSVVSEPVVSKDGCRFLGWYDGDTLFDFTQPITANIALTAKWEEIPADLWYDFSDSACASVWTNGAVLSWLESYEGAEGVFKIENSASGEKIIGDTNGINWPGVHDEEDYANVTGLKFRVKIESSGLSTLSVWGKNYAWSKKAFDAAAATDGWVEYTISVDGKAFDTVNGIWLAFWSNGASVIYIDEITVIRQ